MVSGVTAGRGSSVKQFSAYCHKHRHLMKPELHCTDMLTPSITIVVT